MNPRELLPGWLKEWIKRRFPAYWKYYCPVCEHSAVAFKTFGRVPRSNARCPTCGALERHRLVWVFLRTRTDLFDGRPKRMLHIAPEPSLFARFRAIENLDYVTADSNKPYTSIRIDITDMPAVATSSVDVLYCSHVLEHVLDDRKAMRECARILKPSGWSVLIVPITARTTVEDPTVTDPQERERLFGQDDHVRRYGPDFRDRLEASGFVVQTYTAADVLGAELERYAVPHGAGPIYFCRIRA
jgi:SAM-dependent methyltransferase